MAENDHRTKVFGDKALGKLLREGLDEPYVIAIRGPRATFKSTFARSFLMAGLVAGESGLLIRLSSRRRFSKQWCRVSGDIVASAGAGGGSTTKPFESDQLKPLRPVNGVWSECCENDAEELLQEGRAILTRWCYGDADDSPWMIELDLTSGDWLPERVIDLIWTVLRERGAKDKTIKRAVFDDVSSIGINYPFLFSSKTAGDQFLSALVELMQLQKVNLVMTGTTTELAQANQCVNTACALAYSVLVTSFCEVFGERHVVVETEGIVPVVEGAEAGAEAVPGIVRIFDPGGGAKCFQIDTNYFTGLLGFGTGHIYRPGISVYLFEDAGKVHADYNEEVHSLLSFAFGLPTAPRDLLGKAGITSGSPSSEPQPQVRVVPFCSRMSEALHDSIGVLAGAPLDRTVVHTVDEFWSAESETAEKSLVELKERDTVGKLGSNDYLIWPRGSKILTWPYYGNVLLLAYRNDLELKMQRSQDGRPTWPQVADFVKGFSGGSGQPPVTRRFDYDRSAPETLACALMDAWVAGSQQYIPDAQPIPSEPETEMNWEKSHQSDRDRGMAVLTALTEKWSDEIDVQVAALQELLVAAQEDRRMSKGDAPVRGVTSDDRELSPEACVYVCWYSQLRALIRSHPELADRLGVCSLPGRGFRGDWFVGISKGSVSVSLGREVIAILCSESEDHKRYIRGVGLPTRRTFYTKDENKGPRFLAWARSGVYLHEVFDIHRNALSRSCITDYPRFRPVLYALAEQLIWSGDDAETRKKVIGRLPDQIEQLTKSETRRRSKSILA